MMVSQLLLWGAVGVLAVLVLALARQVGVLHERIAPAGALTLHHRVKPGDPAPILTITDTKGIVRSIGGPQVRSKLLFFISPECALCKSMLPVLHSVARREGDWLDVLLASDPDAAGHETMIERERLQAYPYILSRELGMALGVSKLPYAVLIGETGRVVALGLVNTREHLESLFEAKERGVSSLQQFLSQGSR